MSRADDLYGKGADALGKKPLVTPPFGVYGGLHDRMDYDQELVNHAVRSKQPTEAIDPRTLKTNQSYVVPSTVREYMQRGGIEPIKDTDQAGNQRPVVYQRTHPLFPDREPENLLLSGTHRATAALLNGVQFEAVVVRGGFGPKR